MRPAHSHATLSPRVDTQGLSRELGVLGKRLRASIGRAEVVRFRWWRFISRLAEAVGRLLLCLPTGPLGSWAGASALVLHFGLEAQLNHTVTHGAYAGLLGAEDLDPRTYETLALPLKSETWRLAHKIHHAEPSVTGRDPDTVHPLFRVHPDDPWRPWHLLNPVLGGLFVFECWGWDYDQFLKRRGLRNRSDRSEQRKLIHFLLYQYALFPLVASALGGGWLRCLLFTLLAEIVRNYVFVTLQTGSSVGPGVSTWHAGLDRRPQGDAWFRFQVETSKNYPFPRWATLVCGGLDRHIEHHLWPNVPPEHLRAVSAEVREICGRHGVRYVEHPTAAASYWDSLTWLCHMAWPNLSERRHDLDA